MGQIRGPGIPFPLDAPQNTGRGGVIMLQSGGIYVPPAGDYCCVTGNQTVLQWFDPLNQQWRAVSPPAAFTAFTSDGGNFRFVNMSGVIIGANITNVGSGGTNGIGPLQTGSTITFAAPAAGGVTATAQGYVVVGGSVQAPTVTQGGSGFLVPPLLLIDPPPQGGVQATATATISSAGVITGVTMQNVGAGYTSSPNFYIVPQPQFSQQAAQYPAASGTAPPVTGTTGGAGAFPPPGLINPANAWSGSLYQGNIVTGTTGALLTPAALTGSGTVTAIVMTNYGGGYTGAISGTVTFGGTSLGAAAATALFSFCMAVTTTTTTAGAGYVIGTTAITSLGLTLNTQNNTTFFPRPARGLFTSAAGAFSVEDPGFGFQKNTVTAAAGTTAAAYTNTNFGGIPDVSVLQSGVQA
jgi:hypothetical protein